ncbi:MAG: FAD-binding protein [Marinobacter sp.]|nr:FAD-binding protein [Marinobacter sp.]
MTIRNYRGWGNEDSAFDDQQIEQLRQLVGMQFGGIEFNSQAPTALADLVMPEPRLQPPQSLLPIISTDRRDRASHTYGKSFRDIVRGLDGDYRCAPDLIARPSTEQELLDVLDYASRSGAAVIPYGGGSSVVGGTEARYEGDWAGPITVDMERFNSILEVDDQSRAAHIEGGVYGPALEDGLRPHGYTLRHSPSPLSSRPWAAG